MYRSLPLFEKVTSIHATTFSTPDSTCHDEMVLVDEEDVLIAFLREPLDFMEDALSDAIFVFAITEVVLGTSHQSTHIQREYATKDRCWNIAIHDSLSKALHNGSLSSTRSSK